MDTADSGQYHTEDLDFCERVQISTHPRLVSANEITIQQPTILEHAQPILTPTERLRRNDELILKALLDKQTILAEFLPGSNVCLFAFLNKHLKSSLSSSMHTLFTYRIFFIAKRKLKLDLSILFAF